MPVEIRPFVPSDRDAAVTLVLGIQRDEFGIPIAAEDQPDLLDVPRHYQTGCGNFWVAADDDTVVGTIGLLDIGHGHGALRKMFVAPSHRGAGHGIGVALLDTLLGWAREKGVTHVFLGTTEQFKAAHRFYEKTGFAELPAEELPAHFPRMRLDTKFYVRRIA
ncbi:MAG: GNAT family N-acetyltransferase [Gemmatimonadales bacterium]